MSFYELRQKIHTLRLVAKNTCLYCGRDLPDTYKGRPRVYCSRPHKTKYLSNRRRNRDLIAKIKDYWRNVFIAAERLKVMPMCHICLKVENTLQKLDNLDLCAECHTKVMKMREEK